MDLIKVHQFRVGESNYNFILYHEEKRQGIVIDPLEADDVLQEVRALELEIPYVINTHGHWDHTSGNEGVIRETGARLLASEHAKQSQLFRRFKDGDDFSPEEIPDLQIKVLYTPGHIKDHVTLMVNDRFLFVGDTIFLGGCGNCSFGGNPDTLFDSLEKIKTLNDDLIMYCGHEYAEKNLAFGLEYEPGNQKIKERLQWAKVRLDKEQCLSTRLGEEKEHNVFLRSDQKSAVAAMQKKFPEISNDSRSVFKKLRELRNHF